MSRISVLLQDLPADRRSRPGVRCMLTKEQWDEIIAAFDRGVSPTTMFAALTGNVAPFFRDPKQFSNALFAERVARRKRGRGK